MEYRCDDAVKSGLLWVPAFPFVCRGDKPIEHGKDAIWGSIQMINLF